MIELSAKLSSILREDATGCASGALRLDARDVEALGLLLLGQGEAPANLSRKRAVLALASGSAPGHAAAALAAVLLEGAEDRDARLSAAWGLRRHASARAEAALVRALVDPDTVLQREALRALARIGGTAALRALEALPSPKDEATQRLLALSQLLIRSRVPHGKPDWSELARGLDRGAAPDPGAGARSQRAQRIDTSHIEQCIVGLQGDTFGLALSPTLGYEFECHPKARSALLLVEHAPGQLVERIRDASGPVALVTQYSPREQLSTLRYLVISYAIDATASPEGSAANGAPLGILVVRPSGEVVLAGTAVPQRSAQHIPSLVITAREAGESTGSSLAPTSIDGLITNDGIELAVRSTGQRPVRAGLAIGA